MIPLTDEEEVIALRGFKPLTHNTVIPSLKRSKNFGIREKSILSSFVTICFKNEKIKNVLKENTVSPIIHEMKNIFGLMLEGNGELSELKQLLKEKGFSSNSLTQLIQCLTSELDKKQDTFSFISSNGESCYLKLEMQPRANLASLLISSKVTVSPLAHIPMYSERAP